MNKTEYKRIIQSFLWKNWYKLAFLAFLCYIFLQKDLSFSINLNAPFQTEEPRLKETPPKPRSEKKTLEKLSDNKVVPSLAKIPEPKFVFIFSGFEIKITNPLFVLVGFEGIAFNSFLQELTIKATTNNKSIFFIA